MTQWEEMALRIEKEIYASGRSIRSVLEEAGLNLATMKNMRGLRKGPTADTIIKLSRAMGRDPNWLLGWEEKS